jgi:hypothetical protein
VILRVCTCVFARACKRCHGEVSLTHKVDNALSHQRLASRQSDLVHTLRLNERRIAPRCTNMCVDGDVYAVVGVGAWVWVQVSDGDSGAVQCAHAVRGRTGRHQQRAVYSKFTTKGLNGVI